jgi:hypothetical protein
MISFNSAVALCLEKMSDDFQSQTRGFVKVLSNLSKQNEDPFMSSYRPWTRSFLIINRADMKEFVAINLTCPAQWSCEPSANETGIQVEHGRAPTPFDAWSATGIGYDYIIKKTMGSTTDTNLAALMTSNVSTPSFFSTTFPINHGPIGSADFLTQLEASPFELYEVAIHEGTHLFLQFGPAFGGPSTGWQFETAARPSDRSDAYYCYGFDKDQIAPEVKIESELWRQLANGADKKSVAPLARKWIELRKARYVKVPKGKTTDCRWLDTMYERLEGVAEYNALTSLIRLKMISVHDVYWYYSNIFLRNPSKTSEPTWVFYPSGSLQGFLLDMFSPDKSWQTSVMSNPDIQMLEILEPLLTK